MGALNNPLSQLYALCYIGRPMKNLCILLLVSLLSACGAKIAKVNGNKIPLSEFSTRLRLASEIGDPVWLKKPERAQALKEKILNGMVDEILLLQEAKRLGLTATDAELDEELARFKSQYSDASFQDMLKSQHISYDDWKEQRRRNYIIDKLRDTVAPDAKEISDAEIKAFYDQNISDFKKPEMVHVRQILVNNQTTAKMVYDKLIAGENFAALAQQYSISPDAKKGGDVGYFARGSFPPIFDKICFALPIGGISEVVKSDYGFQIFKVIDHQPARTVPFAEAQKIILRSLRQDGGQKQFEKMLAQLRQTAKITTDTKQLSKIEVPHESAAPDSHDH